jgi:hypothetical protein
VDVREGLTHRSPPTSLAGYWKRPGSSRDDAANRDGRGTEPGPFRRSAAGAPYPICVCRGPAGASFWVSGISLRAHQTEPGAMTAFDEWTRHFPHAESKGIVGSADDAARAAKSTTQ